MEQGNQADVTVVRLDRSGLVIGYGAGVHGVHFRYFQAGFFAFRKYRVGIPMRELFAFQQGNCHFLQFPVQFGCFPGYTYTTDDAQQLLGSYCSDLAEPN